MLSGEKLFGDIEIRESEAFVTLTYPREISDDAVLIGQHGISIRPLIDDLAFVAIKNGHHSQTGYVLSNNKGILDEIECAGHVLQLHNVLLSYFAKYGSSVKS